MNKIKKLVNSAICFCAFGALVLSGCTAEGNDYYKKQPSNGDMQLNIYEENDEKQMYTNHGFSRGDLQHLYSAQFDAAKVETVRGTVTKVARVQYPDNDCYLIAIVKVQGDNEVVANLGPVWYANENQVTVDEGDTIQVTGSKIRTNGRFLVIATEFSANGHNLVVRDKQGKSTWGSPKAQRGDADCMIKYNKKDKNGNGNNNGNSSNY